MTLPIPRLALLLAGTAVVGASPPARENARESRVGGCVPRAVRENSNHHAVMAMRNGQRLALVVRGRSDGPCGCLMQLSGQRES